MAKQAKELTCSPETGKTALKLTTAGIDQKT